MIGYHFDLLCPRCGAELKHVDVDDENQHPTRSAARAQCVDCDQQFEVTVHVTKVPDRDRW